jgi:transcriptional regulator with XRE-family HTH domain
MFENKIGHWADIKGIKHNHLAKECGVSIQTFSRWVNNKTQPDLEKAYVLARLLGIALDQLGEFKEEENNYG